MKKMFALVLALCMMLGAAVAMADGHSHLPCGKDSCTGHPHADGELTYTALNTTGGKLGAGHYYLTGTLNTTASIEIDGEVSLCLHGFTISCDADEAVFKVIGDDAVLTLCDCQTGGTITHASGRTGTGVEVGNQNLGDGKMVMYSGAISGNTATTRSGGVSLNSDKNDRYTRFTWFKMYGGTISGNAGPDGGGVFINGNTEMFMYGGTISNNVGSNGGGVQAYGSMEMHGGTISGNQASSGGGVAVFGRLTMTGGAISGNEATEKGGGVISYNSKSPFHFSGDVKITGNTSTASGKAEPNNLAFTSDQACIILEGALSEDSSIGVIPVYNYGEATRLYMQAAASYNNGIVPQADMDKTTLDNPDICEKRMGDDRKVYLDRICTVNVIAEKGGTATGSGKYKGGTPVTCVATPKRGYAFEGWYYVREFEEMPVGNDPKFSFNVGGDMELRARFVATGEPIDPEDPGEGQPDLPQTGDASMLGAWVCLLGAAGAGLKLRRKN